MKEQIEQLKSDKAALEVALRLISHQDMRTDDFLVSRIKMFETKIAELERQADEPFKEAKHLIRHWGRDDLMLDNNGRLLQQVALYVRHLEIQLEERTCNAPHMDN
jgi:hypothetical protein